MENLTQDQITLYESLSGCKIIDTKKDKLGNIQSYIVTDKKGIKRWRKYHEILGYINSKVSKVIPNNTHNLLHNNNHNIEHNDIHINRHNNVEFKKGGKVRRLCLNMTLSLPEFKKLESLSKSNHITWSNTATQIVKAYLKN